MGHGCDEPAPEERQGPLVDVSTCPSPHGLWNRAGRALWSVCYLLLFRPSPKVFHGWRRLLLRLFGARIGKDVRVYPSCSIWAPWNLEMGDYSCLSHHVDCYCADRVKIGAHATISQYSNLCTATHDYCDPHMRLVTRPIEIGDQAWICVDVYVSPGVTIGQGAVVGARANVFGDLPPWQVCYGSPARPVHPRQVRPSGAPGQAHGHTSS